MTTPRILSSLGDGIVIMASGLSEASGPMVQTAMKVADHLRKMSIPAEFQALKVEQFAYPESWVEIPENIRGKTVFLFHSFTDDPDKDLMRLLIICDAIRRSRGKAINLVLPFLPYTRQDRVQAREPFSAKLVAGLLEVNPIIDQMITIDLHAPQIAGFYNRIHVENIPGHALFAPYIRQHYGHIEDQVTIVSTDVGGSKRARNLAEITWEDLGVAIVDKRRDRSGSKALSLVGDVKKHVFLFDDIGDTAGSLVNAAALVREHGAETVTAFISHALLSKKGSSAEQKLLDADIDLVAADTFPRDDAYLKQHNRIKFLSSDVFMADLLFALMTVNGSIKGVIKLWGHKPTFD